MGLQQLFITPYDSVDAYVCVCLEPHDSLSAQIKKLNTDYQKLHWITKPIVSNPVLHNS